MAEAITVEAAGYIYDILIERGMLTRIRGQARAFGLDKQVVVVTNTTLAPLYGSALALSLPNGRLITIPDGEQYKTLETAAKVYQELVDVGLDRGGTIVALGGGVVGDLVGFVAATFLRGVRLVQIPTSLLAMVDASIGGKVGVDLPQGKNLVGAFKQPALVLIDPDVLESLPAREWRCGMAEVVKHGLLADPVLLDMVPQANDQIAQIIRRAVRVKVDVIQADPFEDGIRANLNLGHTFAHAIEKVSNYEWPHGEAVAVGLTGAVRLSHALGLCNPDLPALVQKLLTNIGLPQRTQGMDPEAIYAAMGTDKKRQNGALRFVLLEDVGKPRILQEIPKAEVIQVLKDLQ